MTGYARSDGMAEGGTWLWEVKSVNGRGLDVRCRLGSRHDRLEPAVRGRVTAAFARGSLSVSLRHAPDPSRRTVVVSQDLVRHILTAAADVAGDNMRLPSLDAVLAIPGVVEIGEAEDDTAARAALDVALLAGLDHTLRDLRAAREAEGTRIAEVCAAHLDEIDALVAAGAARAAAQPQAIRARLAKRLAAVLEPGAVPEDRLAQEVAVLAAKADVREELDRLSTHVGAARELLADGGSIGRKLDFLCQELAREANTLCAKSADSDLTRIGLDFRTVIDRLREQVQNLE